MYIQIEIQKRIYIGTYEYFGFGKIYKFMKFSGSYENCEYMVMSRVSNKFKFDILLQND